MPVTISEKDGRFHALAWAHENGPPIQRWSTNREDAERFGRASESFLQGYRVPPTWGEATRRFAMSTQRAMAKAQKATGDLRDYWAEIARHALTVLQQAEAQPAAAPYGHRWAAQKCRNADCDHTAWVPARAAWDRPDLPAYCPDCLQKQPPSDPRPIPQLSGEERERLALEAIDRIIALDQAIHPEPWPVVVARYDLGLWHHDVDCRENAERHLAWLLGPEDAKRRLDLARKTAGTDKLLRRLQVVDAPTPVPDQDEENDATDRGDPPKRSPERAADREQSGLAPQPSASDREHDDRVREHPPRVREQSSPPPAQDSRPVDNDESWTF